MEEKDFVEMQQVFNMGNRAKKALYELEKNYKELEKRYKEGFKNEYSMKNDEQIFSISSPDKTITLYQRHLGNTTETYSYLYKQNNVKKIREYAEYDGEGCNKRRVVRLVEYENSEEKEFIYEEMDEITNRKQEYYAKTHDFLIIEEKLNTSDMK